MHPTPQLQQKKGVSFVFQRVPRSPFIQGDVYEWTYLRHARPVCDGWGRRLFRWSHQDDGLVQILDIKYTCTKSHYCNFYFHLFHPISL